MAETRSSRSTRSTRQRSESRRRDDRRDRDERRRREDFGGITSVFGALAESYVELVGSTARFAGNVVSDLTDDCTRSAVRRGRRDDDDEDRDDRDDNSSCGCNVTSRSVADDCVEVVDRVFDRFHDSLDARREDDEDDDDDARPSRVAKPSETASSSSSSSSSSGSSH